MNLTPEQIAAAQKANLETLSGLTNQALQSIEKLVELNMHIAKQSLSDSMNSAKKALEVKEFQAGQKKINSLVEEWTKNAPAGSDAAVQAMKQAIASANNVFETSQKAVKHAVEVAQTNLSTATETVLKTAGTDRKATKKR